MHTKYVLSTEYKGKLPLLSHGQKKQVNTLDDGDSESEVMFIGAVNVEDKDWVEIVIFGSIQGVFKLDIKAQCNVLPKVAYDKITTKPLQPSSTRYESCSKTCIRPVGKCELPCWARGKGIKYIFEWLMKITCPYDADPPVRMWVLSSV